MTIILTWALTCTLLVAQVGAAQQDLGGGTHDIGATQTEAPTYRYIGNSFTHKFHRPSCEFAHRIWHTRIELFEFRRQAIEQHYKPCNWCLPQIWTEVRGKILERRTKPLVPDSSSNLQP